MDPILALEALVADPHRGLPEEVFLLLTRLTPMVNVDLLIKDDEGRTLLTWREDPYYPAGWHIPGGIIRYKETTAARLHAVAASELGAAICAGDAPVMMQEVIHLDRKDRGHFISLLFACRLETLPDPALAWRGGPLRHGQWAWHRGCPKDLLAVHEMYRSML